MIRKGIIMSKTIIISTEDLKNILYEYLYDKSALTDVYCQHCLNIHDGVCPHPKNYPEENSCPDKTDEEYLDTFVNIVFGNYMIPFS